LIQRVSFARSSLGGTRRRSASASARSIGSTFSADVQSSDGMVTSIGGGVFSGFRPYLREVAATRLKKSGFVGAPLRLPLPKARTTPPATATAATAHAAASPTNQRRFEAPTTAPFASWRRLDRPCSDRRREARESVRRRRERRLRRRRGP